MVHCWQKTLECVAKGHQVAAGITCSLGMILYSMASWGGRREIHGVVLRNPCRGLFIWPFAIAGLGFKYFRINRSLMLGHPWRKPHLTAFRRVDMGGLRSNCWATFTAFMHICTKCVNIAMTGWVPGEVLVCGMGTAGTALNSSIHRSVDGFLYPVKIIRPLYHTSHFLSSNHMPHPALHRGRIPNSKAIPRLGMICLVRGCSSPGTTTLHVWVEHTFLPSGRLIVIGFVVDRLLRAGASSLMKIKDAPVSAIPCVGAMLITHV